MIFHCSIWILPIQSFSLVLLLFYHRLRTISILTIRLLNYPLPIDWEVIFRVHPLSMIRQRKMMKSKKTSCKQTMEQTNVKKKKKNLAPRFERKSCVYFLIYHVSYLNLSVMTLYSSFGLISWIILTTRFSKSWSCSVQRLEFLATSSKTFFHSWLRLSCKHWWYSNNPKKKEKKLLLAYANSWWTLFSVKAYRVR